VHAADRWELPALYQVCPIFIWFFLAKLRVKIERKKGWKKKNKFLKTDYKNKKKWIKIKIIFFIFARYAK
jgi:hypothetical protein